MVDAFLQHKQESKQIDTAFMYTGIYNRFSFMKGGWGSRCPTAIY